MDSNEVLTLLQIADLSFKWPHLKALHDHAMNQLVKIADGHKHTAPAERVMPRRVVTTDGDRNG